MLRAYDEDKDLYAVIGTKCFHNNYEDNLEFNPITHELQPDGKSRRSKCKTILLGIMYGMGPTTLAERINESFEDCKKIIDDFYNGFKGVKKFTDDSQKMLEEKGYVTDMWGRRRRIADAQLPDFEVKSNKEVEEFNPLIGSVPHEDKALQLKIKQYEDRLSKAKWKKDVDLITEQAKREGFSVKNNKGFINRALRQCVNARIQGTAASMTKRAMILIDEDEELNRLGFHLLITVHDEVLGECPRENSREASKRLSEVMINAAKEKCSCKFKCDGYIVNDGWYCDEAAAEVYNEYKKLLNKFTKEEAVNKIINSYRMFNEDSIKSICNQTFSDDVDSLKYGLNYYKKL